MKLVHFLAAALGSLVLYLLIFGLAIGKPMTIGVIFEMLTRKLSHAESAQGPEIFVFAGSNARFSHSCDVVGDELGRPCTNLGIAAGVGIDFLTNRIEPVIGAGDLVYIPLEYDQYLVTRSQMLNSAETGEWFRRDPAGLLAERGPVGLLRAAFHFDLSWLIQGSFEMIFQTMGGERRFGTNTMNAMGDETDHTAARSKPYRTLLERMAWSPPGSDFRVPQDGAAAALGAFIERAVARGAVVVGGLPTTFDDQPVPEEVVAELARFYKRNGATFLVLPNLSQYPRNMFYDTAYHLVESAQREHSRRLARELARYLPQ